MGLSGLSCGNFMRQKWRFYESSDTLDDGRTSIDLPTFAHIKALQAAGHNSRHVADALQLDLALINKVFGAPQYRA